MMSEIMQTTSMIFSHLQGPGQEDERRVLHQGPPNLAENASKCPRGREKACQNVKKRGKRASASSRGSVSCSAEVKAFVALARKMGEMMFETFESTTQAQVVKARKRFTKTSRREGEGYF